MLHKSLGQGPGAAHNSSISLEEQIKLLQEENDLLLSQLHCVQEELEHYFLMSQSGQLVVNASPRTNPSSSPQRKAPVGSRMGRPLDLSPRIKKLVGRVRSFGWAIYVRRAGVFDSDWYLTQNSDVASSGSDPVLHYLLYGASEGRDPSPYFANEWYLFNNYDVRQSAVNPLLHYLRHGRKEWRSPSPRLPGGADISLLARDRARISDVERQNASLVSRLSDVERQFLNPYAHNRTLTPALNKSLRDFASQQLGLTEVKTAYIDYLATKAIQVEKSCVGRLATTVQDAVARQLVAECVQSAEKIVILEIGALYGISLAILYNHAVTRYPSVHLVCLDPFDGYYGKAIDAVLNQPVNDLTFHRNMTLSNVPKDDYQVIKRYSNDPEAIESAKQLGIDLLIIDGDHSYEGVKFDFDNYFPFVKPGGYVVLDDYNAKEWPGVQQFVDEDLPKVSGYRYLGSISRTAVGRRADA